MTIPRNALLKQYRALFAADGIDLHFTEGALQAIADRARASNTGARGLRSIVERALNDAMYQLPAWRAAGVTDVLVTDETIVEGKLPTLYPPLALADAAEPPCEGASPTGCGSASCGTCGPESEEEQAAIG